MEIIEVARVLRVSVGLLLRRLRQKRVDGELTLPETSALARLDRGGPATGAELARLDQISPQSMGATLASLEVRGLVVRTADAEDGRRVIFSISKSGVQAMNDRRNARTEQLARALSAGFTQAELKRLAAVAPLLERLAENI